MKKPKIKVERKREKDRDIWVLTKNYGKILSKDEVEEFKKYVKENYIRFGTKEALEKYPNRYIHPLGLYQIEWDEEELHATG